MPEPTALSLATHTTEGYSPHEIQPCCLLGSFTPIIGALLILMLFHDPYTVEESSQHDDLNKLFDLARTYNAWLCMSLKNLCFCQKDLTLQQDRLHR